MINILLNIIKETFEEKIFTSAEKTVLGLTSHIIGEEEFYNSLRDKFKIFFRENIKTIDLYEKENIGIDLKSIDKVTITNLKLAFKICNIPIFKNETIDKIIDIIELLEEKGNDITIGDFNNLKKEWEG